MNTTHATQQLFSTDPTGLRAAGASEIVELADGDSTNCASPPSPTASSWRFVRTSPSSTRSHLR